MTEVQFRSNLLKLLERIEKLIKENNELLEKIDKDMVDLAGEAARGE